MKVSKAEVGISYHMYKMYNSGQLNRRIETVYIVVSGLIGTKLIIVPKLLRIITI